ncbi:hypothetical protein [Streptomyces griseus]
MPDVSGAIRPNPDVEADVSAGGVFAAATMAFSPLPGSLPLFSGMIRYLDAAASWPEANGGMGEMCREGT